MCAFYLTVRKSAHGSVVAVCDRELVGRRYEEGEFVLDLTTNFFFEEGLTKEVDDVSVIVEAVKESFTSNIVGNRIVEALVEHGVINKNGVKNIAGIKYAMTFKI